MIFPFWNLLTVTLSLLYKQIARNFVNSCQFGIHFKVDCKNEHFRHILIFYFRTGKNAAQLRDVYGEEALKDRQCQNWSDKLFTVMSFENDHGPSVINNKKYNK